jgi:hypothetical protein
MSKAIKVKEEEIAQHYNKSAFALDNFKLPYSYNYKE